MQNVRVSFLGGGSLRSRVLTWEMTWASGGEASWCVVARVVVVGELGGGGGGGGGGAAEMGGFDGCSGRFFGGGARSTSSATYARLRL
jgi:hypothetical protein